MLKALLWKEWHEHRWRVALTCVWLLGLTAIVLRTRIMPDSQLLNIIGILTAFILPIFVGMGLFASERHNGTLVYLTVQPVSRSRVLAAKVIIGLLALVAPMAICGAAFCLAEGGREIGSAEIVSGLAAATLLSVVLFAWQLLAGLRCRREETYILASGAVLGCLLIYDGYDTWLSEIGVRQGFWAFTDPLAVMGPGSGQIHIVWMAAAVQSPILVGLGFGLWLRYRRLRESKS